MVVNDLIHLKRGGRISTAAALIGTVLNIKPILTLNDEGRVITVRKAKGRKVAIKKLTEIVIERIKKSRRRNSSYFSWRFRFGCREVERTYIKRDKS